MSNRLNRRYGDYAARPRRKKKSGKKNPDRQGLFVALVVGSLALCPVLVVGFFLMQASGRHLTEIPSLADAYTGDSRPAVPVNEASRRQVLAKVAAEPISDMYTPVHIFKEEMGSRQIRWAASGVLHEPSGLIATVEHLFPTSEPSGYFSYCRINPPASPPRIEGYIEGFMRLPVSELNDLAVLRPGPKTLLRGVSTYVENIDRLMKFAMRNLEDQSFEVTSLVSGKSHEVKAGVILLEEFDVNLRAKTNRFVVLTKDPVILGQSGEGYIARVEGQQALLIRSGYYHNFPEEKQLEIKRLLGVPEEEKIVICVVYSFPMNLFSPEDYQ